MSNTAEQYLADLGQRVAASGETEDSLAGGGYDPLFGDRPAHHLLQREHPTHRMIVFLKAQCLSNREIGERLGHKEDTVSNVLRQPWARARLLKEIEQTGRDGIQELLKGAAPDCIMTLIDIARDEKARNSDRVSAANSIVDRFLGKPTQRVESINTNVSATMGDVSKMQAELAEVERELARVTGVAKN